MQTLWALVSQRLEFRSLSSNWGNSVSVSNPGASPLNISQDYLPDRCVHDPHLLDALERAVKGALEPIHVDEEFTNEFNIIQPMYDSEHPEGTNLPSESAVNRFLVENWFRRAARILRQFVRVRGLGSDFQFEVPDTTLLQQPDFQAWLTPIGGDPPLTVSLIELQSEEIVRRCWEEIIARGRGRVWLDWDRTGGWNMVDMIVLKVAAYLGLHKITWLCWTAASHLIVFRLVRGASLKPYLVISDIIQVNDVREPAQDPADKRAGERWMTCIVGCSLSGIAENSHGLFHFDVEDLTSVSGEPNPNSAEQEERDCLDMAASSTGTDSDSTWTSHSESRRSLCIDALLVFSGGETPRGLVAPLVDGSLLLSEKREYNQVGLPWGYWNREESLSSAIPQLTVNDFLGRGSTGTVFSGSWLGNAVAVKIAEGVESRTRLQSESFLYARIVEQASIQEILPTFIRLFRHAFFDVLVLSQEGSALASWDDLLWNERLNLFSMGLKLHQAGLRHGDLEPRNVLRSSTGQLKLIDLTQASEHQCCAMIDDRHSGGELHRRSARRLCLELKQFRRALGLNGVTRALLEPQHM